MSEPRPFVPSWVLGTERVTADVRRERMAAINLPAGGYQIDANGCVWRATPKLRSKRLRKLAKRLSRKPMRITYLTVPMHG